MFGEPHGGVGRRLRDAGNRPVRALDSLARAVIAQVFLGDAGDRGRPTQVDDDLFAPVGVVPGTV